jgi:hypothetical protein
MHRLFKRFCFVKTTGASAGQSSILIWLFHTLSLVTVSASIVKMDKYVPYGKNIIE